METTLIILAGGKSSRMGFDKGLLKVKGKLIIQDLIDELSNNFTNTLISANNKEYEMFKLPIISDKIKDIGPIGGIVSCLEKSKTDLNVFISCDSPYIKLGTLNKLILSSVESNADIVYSNYKNKTHPFPGCFNKRIFPELNKLVLNGERKMTSLFNYFNIGYVDFSYEKEDFFLNLNNPDDLKKIE